MIEVKNNLIKFLEKAYELTTTALKLAQAKEFDQLNLVLENRERVINIIDSLSHSLSKTSTVAS